MNDHHAASDWTGARAEKWRTHLSGMEATLMPVNEPLLRALRIDAPCSIADIGCGGGGTTLEILHRAPTGSVVHGFDISPGLIESARARVLPDERAITFALADVATATKGPFDRLVSRFGIMFFDEPPAAFANLAAWLAPGGRFAFAVWARAADNPWVTSVREAVAEVIEVPSPNPDEPGPFRYAEADTLLTLLERSGFCELDVHDWRGALPIGGGLPVPDAANFAIASFSSFSELLAVAGDAALTDVRQLLIRRFSRHQQAGAVWMDACVHIFTGARSTQTRFKT